MREAEADGSSCYLFIGGGEYGVGGGGDGCGELNDKFGYQQYPLEKVGTDCVSVEVSLGGKGSHCNDGDGFGHVKCFSLGMCNTVATSKQAKTVKVFVRLRQKTRVRVSVRFMIRPEVV